MKYTAEDLSKKADLEYKYVYSMSNSFIDLIKNKADNYIFKEWHVGKPNYKDIEPFMGLKYKEMYKTNRREDYLRPLIAHCLWCIQGYIEKQRILKKADRHTFNELIYNIAKSSFGDSFDYSLEMNNNYDVYHQLELAEFLIALIVDQDGILTKISYSHQQELRAYYAPLITLHAWYIWDSLDVLFEHNASKKQLLFMNAWEQTISETFDIALIELQAYKFKKFFDKIR